MVENSVLTDPATYLALRDLQNHAFVGALALVPLAELLFPDRTFTDHRARLRRIGRNAGLWLVGAVIASVLLGSLMVMLLYWLEINRVGLFYHLGLPVWGIVLSGLLLLDFGDYLFHRVSHQVHWLWLLHAVHHSDPDVDFSTALRTHPLHLLLTFGWKLVLVAAFGIPIWVLMARELVAIPVNLFHHGRFRFPESVDRPLRWLIVTPGMHHVHHSPRERETNSNYATLLSCWDRWFGTYVEVTVKESPRHGLTALFDDRWQTVWGMLATPWRARSLTRF